MLKIDQAILDAEANLKALKIKKGKQLAQKKIPCAHCGVSTRIADLDLLRVYKWHESYCSYEDSGYEYTEDRTQCPSCGIYNRLLSNLGYQIPYDARKRLSATREFFNIYDKLFNSLKRYEEPRPVDYGRLKEPRHKTVINYFIDDNYNLLPEKIQADIAFEKEAKNRGKY